MKGVNFFRPEPIPDLLKNIICTHRQPKYKERYFLLRIWLYFLFLGAVVNISIHDLISQDDRYHLVAGAMAACAVLSLTVNKLAGVWNDDLKKTQRMKTKINLHLSPTWSSCRCLPSNEVQAELLLSELTTIYSCIEKEKKQFLSLTLLTYNQKLLFFNCSFVCLI